MEANRLKEIKEELSEYKNISTYSITFCRMDKDGNMLKDYKGEVIEYRANDLVCDDLSEDLELDDLEEV